MKRLCFLGIILLSLSIFKITLIKIWAIEYNPIPVKNEVQKPHKKNHPNRFLFNKKPKCNKLVWSDEFDGNSLDESKWVYEIGNGCPKLCGWGNEELQHYTKENIKVEDGKLIITAQKNEITEPMYTSGRIKTEGKMDFKFGRIDVSAKLPKGKGIWPAIWMLGTSIREHGWPICGEIDIMELRGSTPKKICGTIHFNNKSNRHEFVTPKCYSLNSDDFSNNFHLFSIVWDKHGITWLVDDNPYMEILYNNININQENIAFKNNFYVILNLAVGGRYDGNPTTETIFPQTMEVDFIKIYKK